MKQCRLSIVQRSVMSQGTERTKRLTELVEEQSGIPKGVSNGKQDTVSITLGCMGHKACFHPWVPLGEQVSHL